MSPAQQTPSELSGGELDNGRTETDFHDGSDSHRSLSGGGGSDEDQHWS